MLINFTVTPAPGEALPDLSLLSPLTFSLVSGGEVVSSTELTPYMNPDGLSGWYSGTIDISVLEADEDFTFAVTDMSELDKLNLQDALQKLNESFSLLTGVSKQFHEMAKSIIQNIRA